MTTRRKTAAKPRTAKVHTFDSDNSPIAPYVVADAVVREVEQYLGKPLPNREALANAVGDYAEGVYSHNERWRKQLQQKLRGDGQRGLAWIYMFSRHWLTAEIGKQSRSLVKCLPPEFHNGIAPPTNPDRKAIKACLRDFGVKL